MIRQRHELALCYWCPSAYDGDRGRKRIMENATVRWKDEKRRKKKDREIEREEGQVLMLHK